MSTDSIRRAAATLRAARAEHDRVESALAALGPDTIDTGADVTSAETALAEALAARQLGDDADVDGARAALAEARQRAAEGRGEAAEAQAVREGLQRRLAAAQAAVAAAEGALVDAEVAHLRAVADEAEVAYNSACRTVAAAHARHRAAVAALAVRNATLPNSMMLADDLHLPVVGEAGRALVVAAQPNVPGAGVGADLLVALAQTVDLEAELAAARETAPSAAGRAAAAIGRAIRGRAAA